MTSEQAWAALDAEFNLPDKPKGARTVADQMTLHNMPETTARKALDALVKAGKLRKLRCWIPDKNGKRSPGNAYIPTEAE